MPNDSKRNQWSTRAESWTLPRQLHVTHCPHPRWCMCACWVPMSGPILCNPLDCGLPGSSVHGISQARVLEWVEISSCRGSSWIRYQAISDDQLVNHSNTQTVFQDNSIAKMNPQPKFIKYLKKIKITQERHSWSRQSTWGGIVNQENKISEAWERILH